MLLITDHARIGLDNPSKGEKADRPYAVALFSCEVAGWHGVTPATGGSPCCLHDDMPAAGRIKSVTATIRPENVHGGTSTTAAARALAAPDDAGHIVAKLLGGQGGATSDNVMAQLPAINRGPFRDFEKWIASQVKAGKSVEVELVLSYPDATTLRPSGITYTVTVDGVATTRLFAN